jgi:hypothetical protein
MGLDSTQLLPGTLYLLILRTLAAGPLHGYAIARRIKQCSEDAFDVEEGREVGDVGNQPESPVLQPYQGRAKTAHHRGGGIQQDGGCDPDGNEDRVRGD